VKVIVGYVYIRAQQNVSNIRVTSGHCRWSTVSCRPSLCGVLLTAGSSVQSLRHCCWEPLSLRTLVSGCGSILAAYWNTSASVSCVDRRTLSAVMIAWCCALSVYIPCCLSRELMSVGPITRPTERGCSRCTVSGPGGPWGAHCQITNLAKIIIYFLL